MPGSFSGDLTITRLYRGPGKSADLTPRRLGTSVFAHRSIMAEVKYSKKVFSSFDIIHFGYPSYFICILLVCVNDYSCTRNAFTGGISLRSLAI